MQKGAILWKCVNTFVPHCSQPDKIGQHQVLTVRCIVIQFALSWFVCERNRLSLINPRVLEKTVAHAVSTWRCWTLPLLQFDHERMQLVYEFLFLKKILRNHLFSEHMQWNYASFNVKIKRLTSISSNKIIKLPKYFRCGHSSHVIPLIETIPHLWPSLGKRRTNDISLSLEN